MNDRHAKTVLVVDDTSHVRRMLRGVLERAGCRVLDCDGAASALAALAIETPDVMVIDYMMPQMDGPDLVRLIRTREATRATPILMLSASQESSYVQNAFAAGVNEYLTKPPDRTVLIARIGILTTSSGTSG